MNDSKVSIIIPTYNRADLLSRSVYSVLKQTYKNIEVLIIDDASTDKTESVVNKIIQEDDRVRYIKNSFNTGPAISRNHAVSKSNAKYICFLDDDDEWLPNKIESQLCHIANYPVIGCFSGRVDGYSIFGFKILKYRRSIDKQETSVVTLNDVFFNNGRFNPSSVMIKKELFEDVGGFDESLVASQGRDLFVRLLHKFGNGLLLNKRLVNHYQTHGLERISTSNKHLKGGWDEFKKNKSLMNYNLIHWRLFILLMREAKFSTTKKNKVIYALKALTHIRIWRLGSYLKALVIFLIVR
jgi:glycosyltransferase involved in cell wall biosynthesis